ncbi:MAG: hypothetical protein H7X77_02960 [Anaerolineae bacterium]|nr:hypothetical protein [Anaerolineae bacterium]
MNAGLQIVAVGQGEPKHIVRYCHKIVPGVDCLVRDDTTAYRAYGIHRAGFKDFISLDMAKAGFRAALGGNIQGETTGDTAMKPATFIVGIDGLIQYTYYSAHPGDHPQIEDLLNVARQLKA